MKVPIPPLVAMVTGVALAVVQDRLDTSDHLVLLFWLGVGLTIGGLFALAIQLVSRRRA